VISWGGEVEDVLVRTFGAATADDLRAYLHLGISDSRWRPGMRVLMDHRELDWSSVQPSDVEERVSIVTSAGDRLGRPHVATVLGGIAAYGLQRMMHGYSDNYRSGELMDAALFYDIDEARAWLAQFPASDLS